MVTKPAISPAPKHSMYSLQLRASTAIRSCLRNPLLIRALASRAMRAACSAKVKRRSSKISAVCSP